MGQIASLGLGWIGKTIEHGPWPASGTRPAFGGEGGERGERGAANACRLESCVQAEQPGDSMHGPLASLSLKSPGLRHLAPARHALLSPPPHLLIVTTLDTVCP